MFSGSDGCVTSSSVRGGSALLLLLSVSFVQTFLRWLSGAAHPFDFYQP